MSDLDQFYQEIEIAKSPLKNCRAYKMDSTDKRNDMRKLVDIGTCHCCDYFLPHKKDTIVLIEETCLATSMQSCRAKYSYLKNRDRVKFANKRIREEMCLKAYGSMLVLCRLMAQCSETRERLEKRKYMFWLVASDAKAQATREFQNLKIKLNQQLTALFGKEIMRRAEVLPPEILKKRLTVAAI